MLTVATLPRRDSSIVRESGCYMRLWLVACIGWITGFCGYVFFVYGWMWKEFKTETVRTPEDLAILLLLLGWPWITGLLSQLVVLPVGRYIVTGRFNAPLPDECG